MKRFLAIGLLLAACAPTVPFRAEGVPATPPPGAALIAKADYGRAYRFALSPEGKRAAWMNAEDGTLSLTQDGADRVLTRFPQAVETLAWTAAGDALLVATTDGKLGRVSLADGTVEPLVQAAAPFRVSVASAANAVAVLSDGSLTVKDLGAGTERKLAGQPATERFSLAPDGKTLAFTQPDVVPLMDVATERTWHVTDVRPAWTAWLPDGRLLVADEAGPTFTLRIYSRYAEPEAVLPTEEAVGSVAFFEDGGGVSPDGRWLLLGAKGGTRLVSLVTGQTYRASADAWRGWADERTVIARYATGLYGQALDAAFDMRVPLGSPPPAPDVKPDLDGPWTVTSGPSQAVDCGGLSWVFADPDHDGLGVIATRAGGPTLRGGTREGGVVLEGGEGPAHEVLTLRYDPKTRILGGTRGLGDPDYRGPLPIELRAGACP